MDRELINRRSKSIRRKLAGSSPDGKPIISFLGYIRSYKGLDRLVRALNDPGLRARGHFLIAGAGRVPGRKRLEKWPEVTLVNEYLSNVDFITYLRASDLIVLPYRDISQSGLLMTAVAEGIPVLVTDRGAMAETVIEHDAGWIIDEAEPGNLQESLTSLLGSPRKIVEKRKIIGSFEETHFVGEWCEIARNTGMFYENISRITRVHGSQISRQVRVAEED